jgi:hypothetical protein
LDGVFLVVWVAGLYCPVNASFPVVCPSGSYCGASAAAPTACPVGAPLSNLASANVTACSSYGMRINEDKCDGFDNKVCM